MPRIFIVLLISIPCLAQQATSPPAVPSKVIEEFWRIETGGGRLTPEGWYETSRFFIRSGLLPERKVINVIRNGRNDAIEETARTPTWAEVSVSTDALGHVDSLLRFTRSPVRGAGGVLILKGPILTFDLVLTEKQWKLGKDGGMDLGSHVGPQWLITCGGDTAWINLDAAIAYVKDMRANSKDPAVKRNADKTLQQLIHLQ
ncbi:MAG: hypothetical protein WCA76_05945 [Candidatus Sulfotelmatobacter sp.]